MKELIESKWQEILNILVKEHEISEVAVNTWIQPLIIQTITDSIFPSVPRKRTGLPETAKSLRN